MGKTSKILEDFLKWLDKNTPIFGNTDNDELDIHCNDELIPIYLDSLKDPDNKCCICGRCGIVFMLTQVSYGLVCKYHKK